VEGCSHREFWSSDNSVRQAVTRKQQAGELLGLRNRAASSSPLLAVLMSQRRGMVAAQKDWASLSVIVSE